MKVDSIEGDKIEKRFYRSKKFWATATVVVCGILTACGVTVPPLIPVAILGYLGAQGLADLGKNAR